MRETPPITSKSIEIYQDGSMAIKTFLRSRATETLKIQGNWDFERNTKAFDRALKAYLGEFFQIKTLQNEVTKWEQIEVL